MSKECLSDCPRIRAAIENFPEDAHPEVAVTELLEACKAAYDCNGPEIYEVEVVAGFFRKHTETLQGSTCGLDE